MSKKQRSQGFASHEPLQSTDSLVLQDHRTTGPFSWLNPTRAHFAHHPKLQPTPCSPKQGQNEDTMSMKSEVGTHEQLASNVAFQWRSRDNRKGRHTLLVERSTSPDAHYIVPESTSSFRSVLRGIGAMATQYPYWDVSWLVAVIFTLGSCVWVINAFFVWLPLVDPASEFPDEIATGGGWTAFIGATIFELGSVLLMFEAINENRAGCFGWALEHALEHVEGGGKMRVKAVKKGCKHHHSNRNNFVGHGAVKGDDASAGDLGANEVSGKDVKGANGSNGDEEGERLQSKSWQWYPSWHDLTTHYVYELGFLACCAQMFGATVFWVSGFTAIPEIYNLLPTQAAINEGYWVPQIVGGSGFIVSGILFMLETQKKWYLPAWGTLGWHVGVWNFIGALGFTLCGALGPAYANTGAQFEASLATFWGSWAFLIGSLFQWYECLDTHPVEDMQPETNAKQ